MTRISSAVAHDPSDGLTPFERVAQNKMIVTIPTIERGFDVKYPDSGTQFDAFGRWGINLSALGMPALAFPVGAHEGAPLGVQLTAHAWREDVLFDAGRALEERLGRVAPIDPVA